MSGFFTFALVAEAGVPQRGQDVRHEVEVPHGLQTDPSPRIRHPR